MTSMTSFWCLYCWLWTFFAPFSCASNVGFEHVFAGDSIQDSQSELSGIINSSNCEWML